MLPKPESWDDLKTGVSEPSMPTFPRTITAEQVGQTVVALDNRSQRNLNLTVEAIKVSDETLLEVQRAKADIDRLDRAVFELGTRVNSKLDAFVIALIKEREIEVDINAKKTIHEMDLATKNNDALIEEDRKRRDHRRWLVVKLVGLLLLLVGVYVAGGKGPSL